MFTLIASKGMRITYVVEETWVVVFVYVLQFPYLEMF